MRIFVIVAVAVTLAIAAGGSAFADETPQACAMIADSLQRLTCFDKLFPKAQDSSTSGASSANGAAATTSEPAKTDVAKWEVTEDKSSFDDSSTVAGGLLPTKLSYTGVGDGEALLILRCSENRTTVVFSTNMFMTDDTVRVTTRIGDEPAASSLWTRSTNYKAVGLWDGSKAIPFIKKLRNNDKFAVRIEANDRVDAEFNLSNVEEVSAKIGAACKW